MDRINKVHLALFLLALIVIVFGAFFKIQSLRSPVNSNSSNPARNDVTIPTIVEGELLLPKVISTDTNNLDKVGARSRLRAISANLLALTDPTSPAGGQTQKLAAIRIIGELENIGDQVVTEYSPVIRFFGKEDQILGQKIGWLSPGFNFFGVAPAAISIYDITVEDPPEAEKLEITLNVVSASASAEFEPLKIASRTLETKTATYQGTDASSSGEETIDYYSVSGSVVNTFAEPISDIVIYAWAKDSEGKVFAFSKQDFKNDLLNSGQTIDFKVTLLPLK